MTYGNRMSVTMLCEYLSKSLLFSKDEKTKRSMISPHRALILNTCGGLFPHTGEDDMIFQYILPVSRGCTA